ncbi:MAG: penicillin-binding transpeptidase domain-containing protein [Firmicutes bacterium]|nr:penicillin-binding transpeptidase domain-containing protein [Bacillota bacterium]
MNASSTRIRSQLLRYGFIGLLAVVIARVTYVQHADATLPSIAAKQWDATQTIMPMRGSIYDANGDQLAFDMPAYDVDIYPSGVAKSGAAVAQAVASGIASIVGAPTQFMDKEMKRSGWVQIYPYLVNVTLAHKDQLVALFHKYGLDNDINPTEIYDRMYPDGRFASEVVGFVDQTGQGAAGVELEYNKWLNGIPGTEKFQQDAAGNPLPFHPVVTKPVHNGDSVYLSLNASIQHYAEEALAVIKQRFTPEHATIIVSNPNTGAILAMATLPNYNPNDYWKFPSSTLDTNWAISDPFEPGSTFKIVTLTGALATHAISLNQTYMSGVDYVNGVPIHDWNIWGWGRITYREAMMLSSNVGFIHIGQAEGPLTLAHYIHLYGMDKPTGIDLPGEGTSILFNPHNINAVDFATTTFGQGLAVTPIQQMQEVDAVANGGRLLTPYVVQKVVAPNGKVVYNRRPRFVRRVAPKAIMKEIANVMVEDVSVYPGIDTAAAIPGYSVAGKSGTANIPDPKTGTYYANRYNLSFVGFVPANHPRIAIIVTVSDPHNTAQFGNDVASPAAAFVMSKTMQYLRVPPQGKTGTNPFADVSVKPYAPVPNVTGLSVSRADTVLKAAGFAVASIDHTGTVTRQWPAVGTREAQGTQVVIASSSSTALTGRVKVPDLRGMPMVEAVSVCSLLGIELNPVGDGYVSAQSLPAGRIVPLGTKLTVHFSPVAARE